MFVTNGRARNSQAVHESVQGVVAKLTNEGLSIVVSPDLTDKWHVEEDGKRRSVSMSKEKAQAELERVKKGRAGEKERSMGLGQRLQGLHQRKGD